MEPLNAVTLTPSRAVTYARKSTIDKKNPGKSVNDQADVAREEVERRGWTLVAELSDEVTASRFARGSAKIRPDFVILRELVETGKVDAIITFEQSRLARKQSDLWLLIEACQENGVILVVDGREIDPTDPGDLVLIGVKGGMDVASSEETRKRIVRGKNKSAAKKQNMAGLAPYGYRRTYDPDTKEFKEIVIVPDEAREIREMVEKLLAGKSMRSVCLDLRTREVPAPAGGRWYPGTVRGMVLRPTYAARRIHRGVDIGPAGWPPIISEDDHNALKDLLGNPERVTMRRGRPGGVKHLLSGVVMCGECGKPMRVGKIVRPNEKTYTFYRCQEIGCYTCAIKYESLNSLVEKVCLGYLEQNAAHLAASDSEAYRDARDEVRVLRARQAELAVKAAEGELSMTLVTTMDAKLTEKIKAAEDAARAAATNPLLDALAHGDVHAGWAVLDIVQRTQVLKSVVQVSIRRKQAGDGNKFNPERVSFRWL